MDDVLTQQQHLFRLGPICSGNLPNIHDSWVNSSCSMDKIPAVLAVPMDARIRHPQRPAQGSHGLRHHLRGLALPQDVHHPVVNLPKLGL